MILDNRLNIIDIINLILNFNTIQTCTLILYYELVDITAYIYILNFFLLNLIYSTTILM